MTSEFELRTGTAQDAAAIAELWLSATAEVAAHEPIYTPDIGHDDLARTLAEAFQTGEMQAYVVYTGTTLAAYATFRVEEETPKFVPRRYLYVIDLDVSPQFRSRGLSRRLMERLERHAKAQGIYRLELTTAFADPRAKAVWERQGFKPHLLFMHKDL